MVVTRSGKNKKNDKSQVKIGVFEKIQQILQKKKTGFVSLNLPNSLYSKAFKW